MSDAVIDKLMKRSFDKKISGQTQEFSLSYVVYWAQS